MGCRGYADFRRCCDGRCRGGLRRGARDSGRAEWSAVRGSVDQLEVETTTCARFAVYMDAHVRA